MKPHHEKRQNNSRTANRLSGLPRPFLPSSTEVEQWTRHEVSETYLLTPKDNQLDGLSWTRKQNPHSKLEATNERNKGNENATCINAQLHLPRIKHHHPIGGPTISPMPYARNRRMRLSQVISALRHARIHILYACLKSYSFQMKMNMS